MFTLAKYPAGFLVVRLSATCDTTQGRSGRAATWYDRFPGGCVTAQLDRTSAADAGFATEARSIIDFTTRQALQQALEQRSGGRLNLDDPLPG